MPDKVQASEFLQLAKKLPVLDVRSPAEYNHGHIPGAVNLPLFENAERAAVGTLYIQQGSDPAIQQGREFVEPKLMDYVAKALIISPHKELLIHCWRGGMRSESLAAFYESNGFKVSLLEGGYKAYRQYIRQQFGKEMKVVLLGGATGCAKTGILGEIRKLGEQVIDLESLANHKGSVFGHLGQTGQPTTEQFENDLYSAWAALDTSRPVWIELESRQIGKVFLPDTFYNTMLQGEMVEIIRPTELRINQLVTDYALYDIADLAVALDKIKMHMGTLNHKNAHDALYGKDFRKVAEITLDYYDKTYENGLAKRPVRKILTLELSDPDNTKCAVKIVKEYNNRI